MEATWNEAHSPVARTDQTSTTRSSESSIRSYLAVAFVVFIASSYLDNVRGPLLPTIASALGEKNLGSSAFLSLGNVGTFLGILLFATFFYNADVRKASVLGWIFCGAACVSALLVQRIGIYPLAIALGLVIATVQSIANLLVLKGSPESFRSRNFCALHLMFGVGSFFAPIAASQVAKNAISWQTSIAFAASIFLVGLILTLAFFPKTADQASSTDKSRDHEPLALNAQKIVVLLTFLFYATAQILTAQWLMNYLRNGKGFDPALAARYVSLYFVVVTLSRVVSYFVVNEKREKFVLNLTIFSATAFLALGHFWPAIFIAAAIQAPFYPIYLGRMSRIFKTSAKRMTLMILLSAQVGLIISHSLLAGLADKIGIANAYWLPAIAMVIAAIGFNFQEFKWKPTSGERNV